MSEVQILSSRQEVVIVYSVFAKKINDNWDLLEHSIVDDDVHSVVIEYIRLLGQDVPIRVINEVLFGGMWNLEEVLSDAFESLISVSLKPFQTGWRVRVAHGKTIHTGYTALVEKVSDISTIAVKMICLNYSETSFALKYSEKIIKGLEDGKQN
jgi:hypothetical protein